MNKAILELLELLRNEGSYYNSQIELGQVGTKQPFTLIINGTKICNDILIIQSLAELDEGDAIAVVNINQYYLILGKVVSV